MERKLVDALSLELAQCRSELVQAQSVCNRLD